MSNNLPRGLPWIDWDEWTTVKDFIYSNNVDNQIAAVECVAVWRLRGKLPHSIESTVQLLEIGINDHPNDKNFYGSVWRSENELRLQYSLAIVRAVNGLVDCSQQGYFAESIYGLAAAIGLPGWFVELRHDATHNQIPTLNVLRAASIRLIEWYRCNYWLPQSEYLKSASALCVSAKLSSKKEETAVQSSGSKEEKGQHQKANQQNKGEQADTSSPVDDMPSFESLVRSPGSTFFTEIFLPAFVNSICKISLPESSGKQKKLDQAKTKVISKMFEYWWDRILKIQQTNQKFLTILTPKLCVLALETITGTVKDSPFGSLDLDSEEVVWRLLICRSWVDKLFSHMIDQAVDSKVTLDIPGKKSLNEEVMSHLSNQHIDRRNSILGAVLDRCDNLRGDSKHKEIAEGIMRVAEMICATDLIFNSVTHVLADMRLKEIRGIGGHDSLPSVPPRLKEGASGDTEREKDGSSTQDEVDDDRNLQNKVNLTVEGDEGRSYNTSSSGSSSSSSSSGHSNSNKRQRTEIESEPSPHANSTLFTKAISSSVNTNISSRSGGGDNSVKRHDRVSRPPIPISTAGWFTCPSPSVSPWPIGLLSGECLTSVSRCPLYLLEEVRGDY